MKRVPPLVVNQLKSAILLDKLTHRYNMDNPLSPREVVDTFQKILRGAAEDTWDTTLAIPHGPELHVRAKARSIHSRQDIGVQGGGFELNLEPAPEPQGETEKNFFAASFSWHPDGERFRRFASFASEKDGEIFDPRVRQAAPRRVRCLDAEP